MTTMSAENLAARVSALEGQVLSSLYASVMTACRILTETGPYQDASYLIAQPTFDTKGRAVCLVDCLHNEGPNEDLMQMFDELLCGYGLDTESTDEDCETLKGTWTTAVRFVESR